MSAAQLLKRLKESGISPDKSLARVALVCALMSVVATASTDNQQEPAQKTPPAVPAQTTQNNSDADQLRKRVQQLTAELTRIKKRVAVLEKDRQVDSIQDKLGKEEQRAEILHTQLLATVAKETDLQARMDQIDEQLRPENMDRSLAGVGSLHPEDAREALRRRLTNEKRRVQSQLDLLHQNHTRLQSSLADSDAAIQRLRLRLMEATRS
jgi:small-conductance mechanosensitive channel